MIKRGWKTTEFWLSIAGIVLGLVKNYALPDIPDEAFYVIISYILGRALTKKDKASDE
ncbi:unnamed protein product [marine sediment metagenome]|uniref:Holin n=1 Tax=marine sediment metagenome TaxID=412755 RepID=X1EDJ2_9ZZZZ